MAGEKRLLITVDIPVRWSDEDVNGHVNNATYFTYFEQTRVEWLRRQPAVLEARGQGVVIAQTSCSYLRPIAYPETLKVTMYAGRVGRASVTTHYEIENAAREVRYAEGEAVLVWVDRSTGRALPLPERLRSTLTTGAA